MDLSEKKKIIIGPSSFAESNKISMQILSESGFDIIPNLKQRKLTRDEIKSLLDPQVIGIIAGLESLDRDVLASSNLKVISRCGSGMSNVDIEAAKEFGIKVFSTPHGPTNAVAELVVGSLISLMRGIHLSNDALHHRKWERIFGSELSGKKVVIVGFGRIGRRVAHLLQVFNVETIAVDPVVSMHNMRVKRMTLNEALPIADILTLHCDGNTMMLGSRELNLMKKGAYLLNAARGELIDEAALIDVLDSDKLAGAWIDAFSEEPYKGRLCDHPRVLLTSHIGSYTKECRQSMEIEAVENLLKGLKGL